MHDVTGNPVTMSVVSNRRPARRHASAIRSELCSEKQPNPANEPSLCIRRPTPATRRPRPRRSFHNVHHGAQLAHHGGGHTIHPPHQSDTPAMALSHSALIDAHTTTSPPTSRPPTSAGPLPTNDDIEAIIQMATSAHAGPAHLPPRDTRTQLFVGNLPYRVRWQDLKDLFRRAGTVLRADVSLAPDNRSRGYGTVLLATAEDAGRAVDMFNGFVWQTRTLEVRLDRMAAEDPQMYAAGLSGGVGLGGSVNASAAPSPFGQPKIPRIGPSPPLYPVDEQYLKTTSPTMLAAQLSGTHTPLTQHLTGSSTERSRSLFVGNVRFFHYHWRDLFDVLHAASLPHTMARSERPLQTSRHDPESRRRARYAIYHTALLSRC